MTNFLNVFKIRDLRNKVFIILGLLALFRIMAAIPTPGVNVLALQNLLNSSQLFSFLNLFSGGGLSNLSIVMLGVGPYITSTIVMQLLTIVFPNLKKIYYEEGEFGRAKFNRLSRWLTVPFAAIQAFSFINFLGAQGVLNSLSLTQVLMNVVIITAGSVALMWIGELISEQGIGNGISLIIFAGIVSALPSTIQLAISTYTPQVLPSYIAFLAISIIVIAGVVFINEGERKVPISYARRIRGNKMYGGVSSYLPLKVNQAGVIPIIFAISLLLFPQFLAQITGLFSQDLYFKLNDLVTYFFNNLWLYGALYFILVVIFTYFYTAVTFNPEEISKNLQKSGGFIPGLRPGDQTSKFLGKIINRTTLFGSIFLGLIAVLPIIVQGITNIQFFTLGGTSILIVVSVALETMRQVDSQLTVRQYE
ncbi:MAG: preprotein translocase subunit SecY [Candidatus Liptonbacteria bacterium CG11_big_fil_rev_8_21_14_0_20_35_14]|uniref:Protein translocase subunit SecY n=1 Tax=Candidatus Liptonbacteria bacterium CG11_big_fil_rev_8_21_14_0_20_35_14 TaxID=1974634 RepID=A0A2H0N862_9BACT|nr:MAG: preprotein translocase subunit SecY [Candidatus Liptonbacteria bacterium CG11_big_fil_rev_8_21_14_0_20_35_14]